MMLLTSYTMHSAKTGNENPEILPGHHIDIKKDLFIQ